MRLIEKGSRIEMIEDKISRLTPDQQREVEDFIDFLITRDENTTNCTNNIMSCDNFHEIRGGVPPPAPLIFADERPMTARTDQDILPDYPEYGGTQTVGKTREPERRVIVPRRVEKEPGKLLDWID
ncbi:MAG: DUF2281 domain-containing protein [Methanoregulaceae archaeon]|nr:DUF2281 domain-containing protein [Methanoregulaceae archaeon]